MKRLLLLLVFTLMVSVNIGANDIYKLYVTYQSSAGEKQLDAGNLLLQEAFGLNLIDSLGLFEKHTHEMEMWIHYSVASWAWEQSDLNKVLEPANKSLKLAEKLKNIAMQGDCYHLLGAVCQMKGDVFHAIEHFEKCYEADQLLNDPDRMSSSLNNLAGNYLSVDQVEQAEKYILRAIELERTMNRPEKLAIRLGMASDIYLKQNKAQAALPYITEAFELDSIGGRAMKMAIRLSQRASVYEALQRYNDAKYSLLKAISILAGTSNIRSTAICYNQLGRLALRDGSIYQAEEYYGHAVSLSKQCEDISTESKACRGLAEVLKTKNPARSLMMLERYVSLSDTMFSEKMAQKLSLLQAKYNQAEGDYKAQILEQKVKFQRLLLFFISSFLLLILVVLCIWFVRRKRKIVQEDCVDENSPEPENKNDTNVSICLSDNMEILEQYNLTKREKEIVHLCCKGLLDKEIASQLAISERTVGSHKTNIFRKCGVNNTVELVHKVLTSQLNID